MTCRMLVSVQEGLELVENAISPLATEKISTSSCLNRILSVDVLANLDSPRFKNSQVDGYAIGCPQSNELVFQIIGDAYAGQNFKGCLDKNIEGTSVAVKIRTGAPIPDGTFAVVMQEVVLVNGKSLILSSHPEEDAFVRQAGCDFKQGDLIANAGTRISAHHIGALIAGGVSTVEVRRKPRCKIIATGDEIVEIGNPLGNSQIYDATSPIIKALLEADFQVTDLVQIPDTLNQLKEEIESSKEYDFLSIIGGASVGDRDYTAQALEETGYENIFSKVKMRPGMPTSCFRKGNKICLSVPGNPVSAFVSMLIFGKKILQRLEDNMTTTVLKEQAILANDIKKSSDFTMFLRANLRKVAQGLNKNGVDVEVIPHLEQGSHLIGGLSKADCLIYFPPESSLIQAGEVASIIRI